MKYYTIMKYLRISAEDIDLDGFDKYESNSIQNQRDLLDDFISRIPEFAGCEVIEALDDGRTGTNFLRPGAQKVIEMAQKGQIQCIVVKDLSRWGRNYIEVGDFLEQKFPEWGTRFISINDMYDSATLNGGTGGIDIAFRNLIYDLYSQDLSEKVRSAKISAAKSGKCPNPEAFYGYIKTPGDMRKLAIDEPAAVVVRRIFDLAEQGYSLDKIAKTLNDEGVPTPQERKMQLGSRHRWTNGKASFWYGSVAGLMLRDERYMGKWIYGKTTRAEIGKVGQVRVPRADWIVVPGAIPAIVTEEQFEAANRALKERRSPHLLPTRSKLIFPRKLRCGSCGMALKAIQRMNDVKFHCDTKRVTGKFGCPDFWVHEQDLAAVVLAALQHQIAVAVEARKALEERAENLAPKIETLRGEVSRLQKLIEKSKVTKMELWEKYRNGGITAEQFQRENEKADDQAKKYAAKIPEIETRIRELESETGRENVFVERFGKQTGITELTPAVVAEFKKEVRV
jgi:DNA invertase Pin-like site-specific DNA recombinase/cell division protein FtsB